VKCDLGPRRKELAYQIALLWIQGGEAWQWCANVTIERWWYAPDAAIAILPLFNLIKVVLFHAVRGIRDYRV